jgi:hypothetical protein
MLSLTRTNNIEHAQVETAKGISGRLEDPQQLVVTSEDYRSPASLLQDLIKRASCLFFSRRSLGQLSALTVIYCSRSFSSHNAEQQQQPVTAASNHVNT